MLCCIFNYAPHYRNSIYNEIQKEFGAHFYFGESLRTEKIKKINLCELKGFQKEHKVFFFNKPIKWEWCGKMIFLPLKKKYDKFLITPNQFALNQWLFLLICKILNKKVYVWEHGIKDININPKIKFVIKLYYCFITGSFIYGDMARKNMIELGFNSQKLHTIYNSLDFEKSLKYRDMVFDSTFYYHYFNNYDPVILYIGRLTKNKKIELLVDAHKKLINRGANVNIVLIGDGDFSNYIKNKVKEYGLHERYFFSGAIYDEAIISKFLYNATLSISPGDIGLMAIHAFSYGLPIITHDNFKSHGPEYEIISEDINGLFFKNDDVNDLTEKIQSWLNKNLDREEIRKRCYIPVDKYYNLYNQIKIFKQVLN